MLDISIPVFINQWYCFAIMMIFCIFPIAQSSCDDICGSGIIIADDSNIREKVENLFREKQGQAFNCFNTSKVTDMSSLFDVKYFDMFEDFNEDISCWDTSSVTSMYVSR